MHIFTELHGMPARTSYEKAVSPPVCLSVSLSNVWFWQNGRKFCPVFLHHTKDHLA